MSNILVLGGTGFIGQHVISEALDRKYNVFNLSLKPQNNVLYTNEKVHNIYCDISNIEDLKKTKIDKINFDYLVNCVGFGDHSDFSDGGINVIKVHYLGLLNVLNYISINNLINFIQLDTSDSYGNQKAPQSECLRERPTSPYSAAKTAATHLLQMLYKSEGLPVTILRLFLPYGPYQNKNMLIPQVIIGCLKNNKFPVSKGEQLRDFLYIEDLVEAVFLAVKNNKANGKVINIGSGNPIKVKDLVKKINDLIGYGEPQFGKYPYRKLENMKLYPSVKKSKKILNWYPKVSIKRGLERTIKYYKNRLSNEQIK